MERMRELNWYQKGILLLLAAMVAVFGVVYFLVISQEGYLYHDEIFVPAEENGNTVYSATVDGKESSFTVTADKTVTFRYGDKVYGPYTAKEDPTAVPKDDDLSDHMTGIEVREGNEIIFRGGVLPYGSSANRQWMLYNEDGSNASIGIVVTMGDGTMTDADGNVIDPMEPSVSTILQLMNGPELTNKGHWVFWFVCVFFSLMTAISILFADEMFYWRLRHSIRNAEQAEPSDWAIAGRYIGWTVMVIMLLVMYIKGLQ